MDPSPVLRQQSQNKIQRDINRMENEQNKKPANPKSSKLPSSPRLFHKDSENKNPADKKVPVRPVGSRLPVLAKSLHLQTPSNFSQVHSAWEEKPLAGKARTKKPCTRPVPFNFSQPRGSRAAERRLNGLKSHSGAQASYNTPKTKPAPSKGADITHHLSGQSGSCRTLKTSDPENMVHDKGASAVSAEVCVNDLNQLTLNDSSKSSQTAQHDPPTEKRENFQCDPKALLSIIQNEGVGVLGRTCATPQSKPFDCLPQRVSIMKSHHKAGSTRGPLKSVQFSPDPAALQSILLNEGVNGGGLAGRTPRNSVCPPGRGTSIYTPQRVPVRKANVESMAGPAAVKETPQNNWIPQRVPNTRSQPMSALRLHLMGPKSPYCTPGNRNCKSKLQLQQEVVVQRLFDDEEDKQSDKVTHKDPDALKEPAQVSESKVHREEKSETSRTSSDVEPQRSTGGPPFIQAPQRDSVIFFSSGTKLFRAPVEDQPSCPAPQDQPCPVPADQGKLQTREAPAERSRQVNPPEHLQRDFTAQKTCPLTAPAVILRQRFAPLEEARLDHEVATYTSQPFPTRSRFLPPRPRCGNPLASVFNFEESTRFVPIDIHLLTTPSPLHS